MKRTVEITARRGGEIGAEAAWLIAPRPFDHWGQRLCSVSVEGVRSFREVGAANSNCRGYLCAVDPAVETVTVRFTVDLLAEDDAEWAAPDWTWRLQNNRYTTPSLDLSDLAREIAAGATTQRDALRRLIDHAADVFGYGHVEERFNDGHEDVPIVCGATRGSCVEINTYLLAAARSLGIRGQYIAGYWFHPEKTETDGMHCWLAFEPDGQLVFWDLAHALKWAETLDARVGEGLNPAGGRRIAVSCGRGLSFETPVGRASFSHFANPYWVQAPAGGGDAVVGYGAQTFRVEDPDGLRTQFPSDFTQFPPDVTQSDVDKEEAAA